MGKEPERHFNFFVLIFMPVHFLTNFLFEFVGFVSSLVLFSFFINFLTCSLRKSSFTFFSGVASGQPSQVGKRSTCGGRKSKKMKKKSSGFGRDHVARGSSGLKPLRRRTPREEGEGRRVEK